MKILALNGSNRGRRGHTAFLVERLFRGARAAGAECEEVTLADLKIERCLMCDRCQRCGDGRCVHDDKDDVRAVFDKMAAADIVVYATPIYIFGVSALLKSLLERFYARGSAAATCVSKAGLLFHAVDHATCSKPFVSLICCDNVEDATPRNAVEFFRTFSEFMDAPQVRELVRNGGVMCGHGKGEPTKRLADIYGAFETAGRELAAQGRISRATQRRASAEIVPVPFFRWLTRIRLVSVKSKFAERALEMKAGAVTGPAPR